MSDYQSDTYANLPNESMVFTMYTTTFGNGAFMIQPASPDEVQKGFPTVPYLSLEALLYAGQSSNPAVAAVNVTGGNTVGEQQTAGTTSLKDSTGTTRV